MNNKPKEVLVTNIQRMCFHDGPGIRTTVFLKGCNLHCPWCANPENIIPIIQKYDNGSKVGVYGRYYSDDELLVELLKDKNFYGKDGGVTFSGGEPLLQLAEMEHILRELNEYNISIAIESAMQIPLNKWVIIEPYIDYYIIDVKLLDTDMNKSVLGGDIECYNRNVEYLHGLERNILFRMPINKEYTMQEDNFSKVLAFFGKYSDVPVEIFATHELGTEKYKSLRIKPPVWEKIPEDDMMTIADRIRHVGSKVTINNI